MGRMDLWIWTSGQAGEVANGTRRWKTVKNFVMLPSNMLTHIKLYNVWKPAFSIYKFSLAISNHLIGNPYKRVDELNVKTGIKTSIYGSENLVAHCRLPSA